MAFGDPWPQPSGGRPARLIANNRRRILNKRPLLLLRHLALTLGISPAMAHDLIAAFDDGIDDIRAFVENLGIHQHRYWDLELIQHFHKPPKADPVAVVAP